MAIEKRRDWQALCKEVSVEQDSERLMILLEELLKTLDEPGEYRICEAPAPEGRSDVLALVR